MIRPVDLLLDHLILISYLVGTEQQQFRPSVVHPFFYPRDCIPRSVVAHEHVSPCEAVSPQTSVQQNSLTDKHPIITGMIQTSRHTAGRSGRRIFVPMIRDRKRRFGCETNDFVCCEERHPAHQQITVMRKLVFYREMIVAKKWSHLHRRTWWNRQEAGTTPVPAIWWVVSFLDKK